MTLPYVERGEALGVPVLLLHGYADSWRFFDLLLPHLPEFVHAFAFSQRGHGDADRPPDGYRQEDFAADVASFTDVVGLEAAVIAGQSSGGYTASASRSTIPNGLWASFSSARPATPGTSPPA